MSRRIHLALVSLFGLGFGTVAHAGGTPGAFDTVFSPASGRVQQVSYDGSYTAGYTPYYTGYSSFFGIPLYTPSYSSYGCGCQPTSPCGGGCSTGSCASGNCASGNCSTSSTSSMSPSKGLTPSTDVNIHLQNIDRRLKLLEDELRSGRRPQQPSTYNNDTTDSGITGAGGQGFASPVQQQNSGVFQEDAKKPSLSPPAKVEPSTTKDTQKGSESTGDVIPARPAPSKPPMTWRVAPKVADQAVTSRAVSPRGRQTLESSDSTNVAVRQRSQEKATIESNTKNVISIGLR